MRHALFQLAALLLIAPSAHAEEDTAFFEKQIRPILVERCYECHSADAKKIKGGLQLDSKAAWMAGGDSGGIIVPGDPDASLFIRAVRYTDPDLEMPPKGKLSDQEIDALVNWVKRGAPDPRDEGALMTTRTTIDLEAGRQFWAFRPLSPTEPPEVRDLIWPFGAVDRFILAKQEAAGVAPVSDATPRDLIRRLYFDLIGLPPTPEQVNSFLQDERSDRLERRVDELLASPRFGEKWGRHWLDLARYSESTGGGRSAILGNAWRYRNYVIDSFNADKPYDQFAREQLAGDLLPFDSDEQRADQLIATAFLALGPKNLDLQDKELLRMNTVDEQIDTVGRTFLGMTLGCARCHDHKFDPVPMKDYYALAGIFRSTRTLIRDNVSRLVETPLPVDAGRVQQHKKYDQAVKSLQEWIAGLKKSPPAENTDEQIKTAEAALARLKGTAPEPLPMAIAVDDEKDAGDYHLCLRGNVHQPGEPVERGFLQVTFEEKAEVPEIAAEESGRRELANWIASPDNPLTARVYVNRIWHHLFGEGLVASVDNFGVQGGRPSHPELLDYLADDFMEKGWSTKALVRQLALSHTYQLGSERDPANRRIDPENQLRWRVPRKRLSAEELRDAMMWISGDLRFDQPGSLLPAAARSESALSRAQLDVDAIVNPPYRSVYVPVFREEGLNELFEVFDFANPSFTVGDRPTSTLPTQALFLLNSRFVMEQAQKAGSRLSATDAIPPAERIQRAFLETLGRPPTGPEQTLAETILQSGPSPQIWTTLFHTLFASVDFRYLR